MKNNLAVVLIIFGFTIPGLEIVSNALNSFAHQQVSTFYFALTCICGLIYSLASLKLILSPAPAPVPISFSKIFPLWIAFLLLFAIKCITSGRDFGDLKDVCLLLAEMLPGLGKRLILLVGLTFGNELFTIEEEQPPKKKKDSKID